MVFDTWLETMCPKTNMRKSRFQFNCVLKCQVRGCVVVVFTARKGYLLFQKNQPVFPHHSVRQLIMPLLSNFKSVLLSAAVSCHFSTKLLQPSSTSFTSMFITSSAKVELIRHPLLITYRSLAIPSPPPPPVSRHNQEGFGY